MSAVRPLAVAAGVSVAALALSLTPAGIARADTPARVEVNPHLTAHQRHNVRRIIAHLPVCSREEQNNCKYVHTGNGHNITLAAFRADRAQYLVAVKYSTPHGRIIHVEMYR